MALGLSGTTGTLATDDQWIAPRPASFGPDAAWILFRVKNNMLKPGREYQPHITVKTDAGILRPQLLFKRMWPWMLVEAAVIAFMEGFMTVTMSG